MALISTLLKLHFSGLHSYTPKTTTTTYIKKNLTNSE